MVHHFVCWYVKCVEKVPFRKSSHIFLWLLWIEKAGGFSKFCVSYNYSIHLYDKLFTFAFGLPMQLQMNCG